MGILSYIAPAVRNLVCAITMKCCVSNFFKQLSKTERPEVLQFFATEKEGHEGPLGNV